MTGDRPCRRGSRMYVVAVALCAMSALTGCASVRPAALYARFEAFAPAEGAGARGLRWPEVVAACAKADVIFFGESHNDMVCNQLEAELLGALIERGRRPALSMEFFERDTQAAVDRYLASAMDEAAFRKEARQGKSYAVSHRPLIEMARRFGLPVVAANTPRSALRAYRQSNQPFDAYRASLDAAEQVLLPERVFAADEGYRKRFFSVMGLDESATQAPPASNSADGATGIAMMTPVVDGAPASAPAGGGAHGPLTPESVARMYDAQLVWDSAMAESIAKQRAREPGRPVLHVVGSFHVSHDGGLVQAYRALRPRDRIVRIVYRGVSEPRFEAKAEDAGAGDVVLVGLGAARNEE